MRRALLAGVLVTALLSPVGYPAMAQGNEPDYPGTADMLEDATRRIMAVLEMVMRSIPQYEMPEILDNGDIIIRRKPPNEPDQKPAPQQPPSAPLPPAKPI